MGGVRYLGRDGSFEAERAERCAQLYLPAAGVRGLKSSVTPLLAGDAKLGQNEFLLEPVTAESLLDSRSSRNFWVLTEGGPWSATGVSAEAESRRFGPDREDWTLRGWFMGQSVTRSAPDRGLRSEITFLVPPSGEAELLRVRIVNTGAAEQTVTGILAAPLYGRSADNIRDHRDVTSMLNRVRTEAWGVRLCPTLSFDERGHRPNGLIYFAAGRDGSGRGPVSFYPTVEGFIGAGTLLAPEAVYRDAPGVPAGETVDGRECLGGLRFETVTLGPGETAEYYIALGVAGRDAEIEKIRGTYCSPAGFAAALERTRDYWNEQVNVHFDTGSERFDRWMRWVAFQPILRRIYGCSFLPHHDYGRGGRGWRDLWQDCLALLLMAPSEVRGMIAAGFGGVRADGTNATIIGERPGQFAADRNGIARIWMDHGYWPARTVELYLHQTGDVGVLLETAPYFEGGNGYRGTVLEHILLQNLRAAHDLGEHGMLRLRGADWNDALDMAPERGESVAFSCAYAGNLRRTAGFFELARKKLGLETAEIFSELTLLLRDTAGAEVLAAYEAALRGGLSGETVRVPTERIAAVLTALADGLTARIRRQEWIDAGEGMGWFNSYYDNAGRPLEGLGPEGTQMMLTGQVFAILEGVADDRQVRAILRVADRVLFDEKSGGYRLNTDFREVKLDLGRMFGFAYGEKENGAVFSHMAVMFAAALYRRGFVREGRRALRALFRAADDFDRSRIWPGIPEYFDREGRGKYHYLTGAASWYLLTELTEAFGIRGEFGDLLIEPRLLPEDFDGQGRTRAELTFAGAALKVCIENPRRLPWEDCRAGAVTLDGEAVPNPVPRGRIESLGDGEHTIFVTLEGKNG